MNSLILILIILLWPWPAYPQEDSIALAIRLLNEYTEEESNLLTELAERSTDVTRGAIKVVLERAFRERDKTSASLKDLRWLESGERQAKRAYSLVEGYTNGRINALRGLLEKVPPGDRKGMEEALERSISSRDKVMVRFQEAVREKGAPRERPLLPLVDTSPIEEEPAKGKGLWER